MMTLLLPLLGLAGLQQTDAPPAPAETPQTTADDAGDDAADRDDILVTGERARRETVDERRTRLAETPYTDTAQVPLNSRIARKPDQRDFSTMTTNQGLAGLIGSGVGANFDATGGQGLNRRLKKVQVCQASSPLVHEDIACGLTKAKTAIDTADFAVARATLDALAQGTLNDTERYFVETHRYMLGDASDDDALRYDALGGMVDSGAMPATERIGGHRALAAMALKRSDDAAAMRHLSGLAELGGAGDQDLASLAILLDRAGAKADAQRRMREAIALRRKDNAAVPEAWAAFVADD